MRIQSAECAVHDVKAPLTKNVQNCWKISTQYPPSTIIPSSCQVPFQLLCWHKTLCAANAFCVPIIPRWTQIRFPRPWFLTLWEKKIKLDLTEDKALDFYICSISSGTRRHYTIEKLYIRDKLPFKTSNLWATMYNLKEGLRKACAPHTSGGI